MGFLGVWVILFVGIFTYFNTKYGKNIFFKVILGINI